MAIVGIFLLPPIPQSQNYHAFADNRSLLGVPNFLDVVSSGAFIVVGASGLLALCRPRPDGRTMFSRPSDRWSYGVLFLGIALTGLGVTMGGVLWRVAAHAAQTRAHVDRLQADVTTLQTRVQALDDGKVSAKTLTERMVGQKRDILQRVEISRLSGQPVQDGDT